MVIDTKKEFRYKVYTNTGVYIKEWNDVVNKPSFQKIINGGLGEFNVVRANDILSYGEGTDVKCGNQIKVYCYDKDNLPDGSLVFQGELSKYTPVVNEKKESLSITFLGYIWHLKRTVLLDSYDRTTFPNLSMEPADILKNVINHYRFQWGATISQSNETGATDTAFGLATYKVQSFTTTAIKSENLLAGVGVYIKYNTGTPADITVQLRPDDGAGKPTAAILTQKTISALPVTATTYDWVNFIFDEPYQLTASTKYHIVATSASSSAANTYYWEYNSGGNPYAGGTVVRSTDSGVNWSIQANDDFYFRTYYIDNTLAKINYLDNSIREQECKFVAPVTTTPFGQAVQIAQSFTAGEAVILSSIMTKYYFNAGASDDVTVQLCSDNGNKPGVVRKTGTISATTDTTPRWREAIISLPGQAAFTLVPGTKYWIRISATTSAANAYYAVMSNIAGGIYSGGNLSISTNSGSTWTDQPNHDLPFVCYKTLTTETDDYGFQVATTHPSIDNTATTVSYAFNTNNALDAINKVLEMSPLGWYWHLDVNNIVHYHEKHADPDRYFHLGNELTVANFENRVENIINRLYVKGGVVGGTNLFSVYEDDVSLSDNGPHEDIKVDERITVQTTMDIIGEAIIDANKDPEIRTSLKIIDNNYLQTELGCDIEDIEVGETIVAKGLSSIIPSYWNVMQWNVDYWNATISAVAETVMQIMSIDYETDYIMIEAMNKLPDINKRVEDIYRNLLDQQTYNAPIKPS